MGCSISLGEVRGTAMSELRAVRGPGKACGRPDSALQSRYATGDGFSDEKAPAMTTGATLSLCSSLETRGAKYQ